MATSTCCTSARRAVSSPSDARGEEAPSAISTQKTLHAALYLFRHLAESDEFDSTYHTDHLLMYDLLARQLHRDDVLARDGGHPRAPLQAAPVPRQLHQRHAVRTQPGGVHGSAGRRARRPVGSDRRRGDGRGALPVSRLAQLREVSDAWCSSPARRLVIESERTASRASRSTSANPRTGRRRGPTAAESISASPSSGPRQEGCQVDYQRPARSVKAKTTSKKRKRSEDAE
jgi:hypothetical protein